MNVSGASAWRADAMAHRLLPKEFPDAVVTFDPLSGGTLMLSHLCWFVLTELTHAGAPLDAAALLQSVCHATDDAGMTAAMMLDEALTHLLDAGLIHAEAQ